MRLSCVSEQDKRMNEQSVNRTPERGGRHFAGPLSLSEKRSGTKILLRPKGWKNQVPAFSKILQSVFHLSLADHTKLYHPHRSSPILLFPRNIFRSERTNLFPDGLWKTSVLDFSSSLGAQENLSTATFFTEWERPDREKVRSLQPSGFPFCSQFIYSCVCPAYFWTFMLKNERKIGIVW